MFEIFLLNLRLGNRIKDDSSKGAKDTKFGEIGKYFSLRAWLSQRLIRPLVES